MTSRIEREVPNPDWDRALEERGVESVKALLLNTGFGRVSEVRGLDSEPYVTRGYAEDWLVRKAEAAEATQRRTETYARRAFYVAVWSLVATVVLGDRKSVV